MNKSESIKELATALAKAQGELSNASKSSANPFFKSKYADLAEVLNTVKPVFSPLGLSVTQMPSFTDGVVSVETVLMHSSGEWMSSIISAPVGKQDAQGVGSAITYCRRYSLAAVAGIAQEDDDGESAVGRKGKTTSKTPINKTQAIAVREELKLKGISEDVFLAAAHLPNIESMPADKFTGAIKYIKNEKNNG